MNEDNIEISKLILEALHLRDNYVCLFPCWKYNEKSLGGTTPFSAFNCEIPGMCQVCVRYVTVSLCMKSKMVYIQFTKVIKVKLRFIFKLVRKDK